MKCIIAGCRHFNQKNYHDLEEAIKESNFDITEIVSGGAKGADKLGEWYAYKNGIKLSVFKAKWSDTSVPGAIIKLGQFGKYNAKAGIDRNHKMGDYADALIALWDGKSKGTKDMINYMEKSNKKVFVKKIEI